MSVRTRADEQPEPPSSLATLAGTANRPEAVRSEAGARPPAGACHMSHNWSFRLPRVLLYCTSVAANCSEPAVPRRDDPLGATP